MKKNADLEQKLNLKEAFIEVTNEVVCLNLIEKLLKILKFILLESIKFYSVDHYIHNTLDNLLYLLGNRKCELFIFEIFIELITLNCHCNDWDPELEKKVLAFISFFEQMVFDYFFDKNPANIDKGLFENILEKYITCCKDMSCHIATKKTTIPNWIIKHSVECAGCIIHPSDYLLKISFEEVDNVMQFILCGNIDEKTLAKELLSENNKYVLKQFKRQVLEEIFEHLQNKVLINEIVFCNISKTWSEFHTTFSSCLDNLRCTEDYCEMQKKYIQLDGIIETLMDVIFRVKKQYANKNSIPVFFNEDSTHIVLKIISNTAKHYQNCRKFLDPLLFLRNLIKLLVMSQNQNIDIIYHLVASPFLVPLCYKSETYFPYNFEGNFSHNTVNYKSDLKTLYSCLRNDTNLKKHELFEILNQFFKWISSGLLQLLNQAHMKQIELLHLKVLKNILNSEDAPLLYQVIDNIPLLLNIFSNTEELLSNILLLLMSSSKEQIQHKILEVIPKILCICSGSIFKCIKQGQIEIICEKCDLKSDTPENISVEEYSKDEPNIVVIQVSSNKVDFSSIKSHILKLVLRYLLGDDFELQLHALNLLPYLSKHIVTFYNPDTTRIWIELAGDPKQEIRKKLAEIICNTIKNGQFNTTISKEAKIKVIEVVCSTLLKLTKKSLKYSDYDLQNTVLQTVTELADIEVDSIKLECMKIFLYFIMIPTSSQTYIAINKCMNLSKRDSLGRMQLYRHNIKTLCDVIAHLCSVNQQLVQSSLQESLFKISVVLGYDGVKEYLKREAENLLPFLVAKILKNSNIPKLIIEMASIVEAEVSELLSLNYGNIFLHLYLGDMDEKQSRECSMFVEKLTGVTGRKLRKRNFKVILNKLLLNFHEKKSRVLKILRLLLNEDSVSQSTSIEDYILPFFLAFLLYFDLELSSEYSNKENILLSLADLLTFLGPNRIMPLRFKILAMLQTSNYIKYPELTCTVWNSFIKSCDIECLGPHLATIFISMMPLIEQCPSQVNMLLQYLIVENEHVLRNNISDLFFVNNSFLNSSITTIVKKYLRTSENFCLRDKIERYLKYIKHDSLEVKIQSLKQIKISLERNREELDQMILGYNGIDSIIVELVDVLTMGCREKDETLKLMCGEVFGELGAIEPSHLPRRYANCENSFTFFMNEDTFIESALTELIKAFQTDKNARNTDRVALAIQEILKKYDISPNDTSLRNFMWNGFSEAQREVMTPLLSSKYICVEKFVSYPYPLYGSNAGANFQSWLYNITSNLILTLPEDQKSLLQNCFPSMKMDKKVLMHFLPYILLHSLLESSSGSETHCYTEFQTILNSFNCNKAVADEVLNTKALQLRGSTPSVTRDITGEDKMQMQATRVVFILLDFLDRWLRERHWSKGYNAETDANYKIIRRFMKKFCKLKLAKCNYNCGEYSRALMYLEDFINQNPSEISTQLSFLAEIYAQLDESDGVLGVEPFQQAEPSLEQRILSLEVSGKLADAAAIYEHMPRPLKLQHLQGLIHCYLDLDKVNTALYFAEGALDLQPEFGNMLLEVQAEPLWRLGKYDDLENLLNKPDLLENKSWGVQVGRSLVYIKKGERDLFKSTLESIKRQQVESFGSASLEEGAYQHGYNYITRLHCLNELEQIEKTLSELFLKPNDKNYAEKIMKKLSYEWQLRIKVVQTSVRILEPLLCVRRVALNLGREIVKKKVPQAVTFFDGLLGESWLQSVTVARNAGVHQQAYTYVLDAEKYAPPKLFIEKAKLHWLREEHEEALITLKRGLNMYIPDNTSSQIIANLSLDNKKLCAEARLLIATYNDDICSVDVEVNLQQYKDSCEVYREWEKSLVCLAQYQDRIFQNYSDEDKDSKSDLQLHIVNNFGRSLYYGTNYIYQSMPRLLSIWFDYGTKLFGLTNRDVKEERRNYLVKLTKLIDGFLTRLPSFVFLTSFSQIISRISHPQKEVYLELKNIIIKLLEHYPQQCLWMISSVIKSSYPIRVQRCSEILNDPKLKIHTMPKLIKDFTSLAEKLIELCNKDIPQDVKNINVSMLVRSLPRMLNKGDFSEIMMPTHKFRKLILPNPDFKNSQHNPFPNRYVYIAGIEEEMSILNSLQRPRKINLRGSDGKKYTFMLKPKDDLRKDFRLMEFNDIVNHLLLCDPEARQRRLNIRLYSVAPLNEECGLIEWVPNLLGLRPVLLNLYQQRGLGMKAREIKEACCSVKDPLSKKRDVFVNTLLKKHPPVLGDWFRKHFPDAQSWLTARTAYIRTTAVISITGYILGLGDRHGENILLDSTCGDVVHVDFNCLFNKGESFEWPERVPFRLTQNMVSAMGPLGVEGVFRKSCEFTLRVLRSNAPTLMSIVTPFVYDPLVSWPRHVAAAAQSSERVNEQALEHIKNIELRLQGKVKTRSRFMSQCLSVEGQTDYLIKEAMSIDNLCQMYLGWMPYL
ncbi:serine/threonine-protein kinase ATR-like isoform X2 [Sitophilus oryzae]|nr:serine/threonine-protein kinase ATR-like isoform X2 [Sitophilus oryzae]